MLIDEKINKYSAITSIIKKKTEICCSFGCFDQGTPFYCLHNALNDLQVLLEKIEVNWDLHKDISDGIGAESDIELIHEQSTAEIEKKGSSPHSLSAMEMQLIPNNFTFA